MADVPDMPDMDIATQSLMRAAVEGRVERFDPLVARGANINHAYEGRSLLCHIIAEATPLPFDGVVDVMHALINAGADVNAPGPDGMTPLLTAMQIDRRDVVEALLDAGADVNLMPAGKVSPLYLAAEGDLAEGEDWRTRLLVSRGADPDLYVAALKDSDVYTVRAALQQTAARPYSLPESSVTPQADLRAHALHLLSCLPQVVDLRQRKIVQKANTAKGKFKLRGSGGR